MASLALAQPSIESTLHAQIVHYSPNQVSMHNIHVPLCRCTCTCTSCTHICIREISRRFLFPKAGTATAANSTGAVRRTQPSHKTADQNQTVAVCVLGSRPTISVLAVAGSAPGRALPRCPGSHHGATRLTREADALACGQPATPPNLPWRHAALRQLRAPGACLSRAGRKAGAASQPPFVLAPWLVRPPPAWHSYPHRR